MANLTLSVPDEILTAARVQAARHGTTVNAVCREALERLAGAPDPNVRKRKLDKLWAAVDEAGLRSRSEWARGAEKDALLDTHGRRTR